MSLVSLRQQQGNGRTSSAQSASLQVLIFFFSFLSKSLRHMTLCACLVTPAAKRCQQWHHILQKPNRQPPAATSARYIAASVSPSSHCASCHCHHLHWHQSNKKNHNGLCKIRHQLSNCRFDHTFLAADQAQWSWRPMPFLVIQALRQLNVCQLFSPCLGPVHSSSRMVRLCYQEAAGQTSKASLSTSNPQLLTNETLAGCSAM